MGITKKQKEVFEFIKNYTNQKDMAPTQKEIKEHFGLKSFGSVQRYIKYLIDAKYLERDWNARQGLKILKNTNNFLEIPLFGSVAAGIPIEAIESPTETLAVPQYMIKAGHKHFALNISGNSMIDEHIMDGDLAIIRYQQIAEQGQTIVALINGEATIKKFYKQKSKIELHPANKTMSPIIINPTESNFSIAGILVGLIRSF